MNPGAEAPPPAAAELPAVAAAATAGAPPPPPAAPPEPMPIKLELATIDTPVIAEPLLIPALARPGGTGPRCPACGALALTSDEMAIVRKPGRRSKRDAHDPRNRPENLVTPEFLRQHIVAAGMSLRDIGAFHGYTISTLSRRAKQEGVQVGARPRPAAAGGGAGGRGAEDGSDEALSDAGAARENRAQQGAQAPAPSPRKPRAPRPRVSGKRQPKAGAGGEQEGSEPEEGGKGLAADGQERSRPPKRPRRPPAAGTAAVLPPGLLLPSPVAALGYAPAAFAAMVPLPLPDTRPPQGAAAPISAGQQEPQPSAQQGQQQQQQQQWGLPEPPAPAVTAEQAGLWEQHQQLVSLEQQAAEAAEAQRPRPRRPRAGAKAGGAEDEHREEEADFQAMRLLADLAHASQEEAEPEQQLEAEQPPAQLAQRAALASTAGAGPAAASGGEARGAAQPPAPEQQPSAAPPHQRLAAGAGEAQQQEPKPEAGSELPLPLQQQQPASGHQPEAKPAAHPPPESFAPSSEEQHHAEQPAAPCSPAVPTAPLASPLPPPAVPLAAAGPSATLQAAPWPVPQQQAAGGRGTAASPRSPLQPQHAQSQHPAAQQQGQLGTAPTAGGSPGAPAVPAHGAQPPPLEHAVSPPPEPLPGSAVAADAAAHLTAKAAAYLRRAAHEFHAADTHSSAAMLRPLNWLRLAGKGGAALQEAVARWDGLGAARQLDLFSVAVLVAASGEWEQLECSLRLELCP